MFLMSQNSSVNLDLARGKAKVWSKTKLSNGSFFSRRPCGTWPSDRMPGNHPQQSSGATKVKESATLKCEECCAVRGNKLNYTS